MKITMASLALTMLAEVAAARYCTAGLSYCGYTLKNIGTNLVMCLGRMTTVR